MKLRHSYKILLFALSTIAFISRGLSATLDDPHMLLYAQEKLETDTAVLWALNLKQIKERGAISDENRRIFVLTAKAQEALPQDRDGLEPVEARRYFYGDKSFASFRQKATLKGLDLTQLAPLLKTKEFTQIEVHLEALKESQDIKDWHQLVLDQRRRLSEVAQEADKGLLMLQQDLEEMAAGKFGELGKMLGLKELEKEPLMVLKHLRDELSQKTYMGILKELRAAGTSAALAPFKAMVFYRRRQKIIKTLEIFIAEKEATLSHADEKNPKAELSLFDERSSPLGALIFLRRLLNLAYATEDFSEISPWDAGNQDFGAGLFGHGTPTKVLGATILQVDALMGAYYLILGLREAYGAIRSGKFDRTRMSSAALKTAMGVGGTLGPLLALGMGILQSPSHKIVEVVSGCTIAGKTLTSLNAATNIYGAYLLRGKAQQLSQFLADVQAANPRGPATLRASVDRHRELLKELKRKTTISITANALTIGAQVAALGPFAIKGLGLQASLWLVTAANGPADLLNLGNFVAKVVESRKARVLDQQAQSMLGLYKSLGEKSEQAQSLGEACATSVPQLKSHLVEAITCRGGSSTLESFQDFEFEQDEDFHAEVKGILREAENLPLPLRGEVQQMFPDESRLEAKKEESLALQEAQALAGDEEWKKILKEAQENMRKVHGFDQPYIQLRAPYLAHRTYRGEEDGLSKQQRAFRKMHQQMYSTWRAERRSWARPFRASTLFR